MPSLSDVVVDTWVQGGPINLTDLIGSVVVIEVFQVNCPGCFLYSLPKSIELFDKYHQQGLVVIGLATAFEDYDKNTLENLQKLVTTGEVVGETLKALTRYNVWYWKHGWGKDYFNCRPDEVSIFYQIYNDLTPGHSIAVFDKTNGQMMGSCFYHPREHHVSLGIMSVHPDYSGRGVGRQLVNYVLDFTKKHDFKSCRLVSSAINMDSFSLYTRAGFIPRAMYYDTVINVPANGLDAPSVQGEDHVRKAALHDIAQMGELEMQVSGIKREIDYRYAIENPRGVLHASVYENDQKNIDGFMISVKHPALNMLGPCVARNEDTAIAIIRKEIERFRGTRVFFSIAMENPKMVEQMYAWNAINVETHLINVWGKFPGFHGISMPSFLPETG